MEFSWGTNIKIKKNFLPLFLKNLSISEFFYENNKKIIKLYKINIHNINTKTKLKYLPENLTKLNLYDYNNKLKNLSNNIKNLNIFKIGVLLQLNKKELNYYETLLKKKSIYQIPFPISQNNNFNFKV